MYCGRIITKAVTAACMLLTAQPILAEDLIEIYRKAVQNDPQMLSAQYAHLAAGELVNETFGRMLPQVGFEYSLSKTKQDTLSGSTSFLSGVGERKFDTTDYSLTLTQPIFNWSLYTGYEQAKAEVSRANAEYASLKQDFILKTAERYLETLAAADASSFAEAEKAAVGKQLELVQGMMNSGLGRKTELYDAQARYASVEADEIGAQSAHDDKVQALREMVGELSGELATLKENLSLIHPDPRDPEEWMEAAIKQNPRIILQLRALDVSRHEVTLQKAGHMPTLNLTARFNNRDTEEDVFDAEGSETETTDLLLSLSIPIYQGGIVNSRTRRSQQLHQKSRHDLTEMQRAVQRAARSGYYGIISAISKVEALAKSVKSQQLALDSKQRGYRSGLYTSLDVLDAERDAYEAKRDYSRARYDYLLNGLRLKHAVGTLNETDLEGINQWLQLAQNNEFQQTELN